MKGETITLAFFEMAIRLSGELRSVLSRSRLMPGSSPSLATAFHTTERRVTQGCSKDARNDYARLPSSSRAREECIGNGIALGAVTHVWHTTRANYYAPERGERDRSCRRYNTFVSREEIPLNKDLSGASARRRLIERYDASTWPRASTPTIPAAPHYRPQRHRGPPQTSLPRIMQNIIIDKYLNYKPIANLLL